MSETQIVVVETDNPLVVELNDEGIEVTAPVIEETVIEILSGARGVTTQWLLGAQAPLPTEGTIGDVWLVTQGINAGDVFKKLPDGTWEPNGSIRGAGYGVTEVNGDVGPVVVLTKVEIGLSNVDNTADAEKIVSTPTQNALDLKANDDEVVKLSGPQTIAGIKTFSSSPVVPVDSFSISSTSGLQAALDGKSEIGHSHIISDTTGLQAALDAKEDDIAAGTTAQYYRGDKSWQTLDPTAVGLSNVANLLQVATTTDQTVGGIKTFSDSPIVPTPTTNTQAANKLYVDTTVNAVIDAAPGALDTLNELAAALGDDPNFATTVTNEIATKEDIIVAGTTDEYRRGDNTWQTLNLVTVDLTTAQTIAGVKTFSVAPVVPDSSFAITKISGLQSALDLKAPLASPTFTGVITGDGSGLTALNGTEISTGTVADARLSTNVVLLSGAQTLTGAKTFSALITGSDGATITGTVEATLFSGSGADLTSLNGTNVSTGTVAIARLPVEAVYRVLHDGSAWPARPTDAISVEWVGPVVPTAATADDTWVDTSI